MLPPIVIARKVKSLMSLDEYRKEIDDIDGELVRLLDRRASLAQQIGASKADAGRATFDPGRARAVVHKAISRSNGEFPREGLLYVMREVISACLNLQKPLRVGFLGPRDTFAFQAAVREFGSSVDFQGFKVIRDVFQAVKNGTVDYGVVPIENSTGGTVHTTLDAFIEFECSICSEILLPIQQTLLSRATISEIRKVYSHPQAFLQCGIWLKEHLPNAEYVHVDSTAQGMQEAQRDPNAAAIGSELAAEQYGLNILAKSIQDSADNTTRFLVISQADTRPQNADKTSIMFSVKDRPGALFEVLRPFKELNINLSKLESRPTKRRAWEQAFFVDADGHRDDPKLIQALEQIEDHCDSIKVLGSYSRDRSPSELEEMQRAAMKERKG